MTKLDYEPKQPRPPRRLPERAWTLLYWAFFIMAGFFTWLSLNSD